MQLPEGSGGESQFWFNVRSMDKSSSKPWGHKVSYLAILLGSLAFCLQVHDLMAVTFFQVTFSHLFAICNHLPLNLSVIVSDNGRESAPPSLSSAVVDAAPSRVPVLARGNGEVTRLSSLCADTFYNLRFRARQVIASVVSLNAKHCSP